MEIFSNIRYARADRFSKPVLVPLGEDIRSACSGLNEVCPQPESRLTRIMGPRQSRFVLSEDCLRTSVFTPSTEGKRPVLVWIHGGAFVTGSGSFRQYDPSRLCEEGNIVVVNLSYRVGVWGFLYLPEKGAVNLGLEDLICGLQWVRNYISRFGGDPERITVGGQSAGGYAIAAIVAAGRERLDAYGDGVRFQKAILMSPPLLFGNSAEGGTRFAECFIGRLKAENTTPETATVEQMLRAQEGSLHSVKGIVPLCPVGETIFPKGTLVSGVRRILLTYQKNDVQPYVPGALSSLNPLLTRFAFKLPLEKYAKALGRLGIPAQVKRFDWSPKGNPIGACHCMELPLMFADWDYWCDAPMMEKADRDDYEKQGKALRFSLASFVSL